MVEPKDTAPTSGLHLGAAWRIVIACCALAGCASSDPASLAVSVDERLRVLSTLNDDQVSCPNGDDGCPCGAYCNGLTGMCEVDCVAGVTDLPGSIPDCNSDQECTPLGRCQDSRTPPPLVQALTLQISPPVISGNPVSAPVLVPVTVTVTANSLDFVRPDHPAVVRYRFQTAPEGTPLPAGAMPQVKCAADAALADHCDLAGWTFHADAGVLVSDPRTLWVQMPQTATAAQWTLEGRSAWALTPATAVVSAQPVAFPATDPGRYAGTLTWTHDGGGAGANQLSGPVEAIDLKALPQNKSYADDE